MVLISVNTVLGLLKRSTCIRGRTHLAVVAICRFEAEPQSRGARLCVARFYNELKFHIFVQRWENAPAITQFQSLNFVKKWTSYQACALNYRYIINHRTMHIHHTMSITPYGKNILYLGKT